MSTAIAIVGVLALLLSGMWVAAALDRALAAWISGGRVAPAAIGSDAIWLMQLAMQSVRTERPDAVNAALAPVLYVALAAVGLSVVPLAPGVVATEIETGIVLWGACEALTVVAVFLHGWSANAPLPLIGAYRYVAIALPAMLLSMFVLIAAALPAESLSVAEIVHAQAGLWNVVLQPAGLVLFLLLGLALTLRGPFDYADPVDLAGGTSAESSGPARAAWQAGRLAMSVSVAAMASAAFLGGYHGPILPGPLWLVLKTALVIAALVALGRFVARAPAPRMLTLVWTVLLPVAFVDLAIVGGVLLIW
jgi:NADH-quinone oxidoreductase subunit H